MQGASPGAPGAQVLAADSDTEKGQQTLPRWASKGSWQQKELVRAHERSEEGTRSRSKR